MTPPSTAPWPSVPMLERMGLIRCQGDPACTTFVDPCNVPSKRCTRHQRDGRGARHTRRQNAMKPER